MATAAAAELVTATVTAVPRAIRPLSSIRPLNDQRMTGLGQLKTQELPSRTTGMMVDRKTSVNDNDMDEDTKNVGDYHRHSCLW
jgi:hypothetical protein